MVGFVSGVRPLALAALGITRDALTAQLQLTRAEIGTLQDPVEKARLSSILDDIGTLLATGTPADVATANAIYVDFLPKLREAKTQEAERARAEAERTLAVEQAALARQQAAAAAAQAALARSQAGETAERERKTKLEADALVPKAETPEPTPQCHYGKIFCRPRPMVRLGLNWRMAHPNAGDGSFRASFPEGAEAPSTGGQVFNYNPSAGGGVIGDLGPYGEVGTRLLKIPRGPYLLAGLAAAYAGTDWNIQDADKPEGMKRSLVRQRDVSVGIPVGLGFLFGGRNKTLTGISIHVIPQWVRSSFSADATGEGQTDGVLLTGTERNQGASGRTLPPTVNRFNVVTGWEKAPNGVDFDARFQFFKSLLEVTLTYGRRDGRSWQDSVGNESRLIESGVMTRSENGECLVPGRCNQSITVNSPPNQFIGLGAGLNIDWEMVFVP